MYLIAHVFVYLFGYTVGVYQLGGNLKSGKNDATKIITRRLARGHLANASC